MGCQGKLDIVIQSSPEHSQESTIEHINCLHTCKLGFCTWGCPSETKSFRDKCYLFCKFDSLYDMCGNSPQGYVHLVVLGLHLPIINLDCNALALA